MPNGDPRDRFFYPTLTLMIDSYNHMKIISDMGNLVLASKILNRKAEIQQILWHLSWFAMYMKFDKRIFLLQ